MLFPTAAHEVLTVAELTGPDGWLHLDAELSGRAAVLFAPRPLVGLDDDWAALRAEVARGRVVGCVVAA